MGKKKSDFAKLTLRVSWRYTTSKLTKIGEQVLSHVKYW